MSFIVGILTFLLVVNCAVLMLLVLVQLPKKDAGAGLAFGGGAADALFGAGSGNALTKITKWTAFVFVGLAVLLGSLEVKVHNGNIPAFEQGVEQLQQQTPTTAAPGSPAPSSPSSSSTTPGMSLFSETNTPSPAATTPTATTTNGK
jgi:protein translocase SecG subunit